MNTGTQSILFQRPKTLHCDAYFHALLPRLAGVLFDDQRFDAAEAALTRGASSTTGATELLLLSKCQVQFATSFLELLVSP